MTATAQDLSALHAAARDGDRVAILLLADLAEEQGDDARAGAWRFLADPPGTGWERRAWEVVSAHAAPAALAGVGEVPTVHAGNNWLRAYRVRVRRPLTTDRPACLALAAGGSLWEWRDGAAAGWRMPGDTAPRDVPGWARDAILAACRQALSP